MSIAAGIAGERLLVRISLEDGGEPITLAAPSDLRFSWEISGGPKDLSCSLSLARGGPPPGAIAPWSIVQVVDRATGESVWWGRLTDPGQIQKTGNDGLNYAITAEGGQAILDGIRGFYALVDRSLDGWTPVGDQPSSRQDTAGPQAWSPHPADGWSILSPWSLRETIPVNDVAQLGNSSWQYSVPGGDVERIIFTAGANNLFGNFNNFIKVYIGGSYVTLAHNPQTFLWNGDYRHSIGSWTAGQRTNLAFLGWYPDPSAVTLTQDYHDYFSNIIMIHRRYNFDGTDAEASLNPTIDTANVINDVVGRLLLNTVEYDPPASMLPWVDPSESAANVTFFDGPSARTILDWCVNNSPTIWWAVLPPKDLVSLPRLTIRVWDGHIRYILNPENVDISLSGGIATVANQCLVKFINGYQNNSPWIATLTVDAYVPVLANAGITRSMSLDLTSQGVLTNAEAQSQATSALVTNASYRTTGSARIRGPIMDYVLGRVIQPWEMQPGPVMIASTVLNYSDQLSFLDGDVEDGFAVFRATTTSFDASSGETTLGLDGGNRSLISRIRDEVPRRKYDPPSTRF